MNRLSRRKFFEILAGGATAALSCGSNQRVQSFGIPGEIVNEDSAVRGHLLRSNLDTSKFSHFSDSHIDVAIVGAGVSGLCAAWKLKNSGVDNLCVFDLESRLGGTSVHGTESGQSFPWGAHYINIPPREADCIHELLVDIDVITGYDPAGRPFVHPDHVVNFPSERLYVDREWVDGLNPFQSVGKDIAEQWHQFEDDMLRWTLYTGLDGRRGFSMPVAYSTTDTKVRELDRISMAEYMRNKRWTSDRLRWLIDYCCRDDYGGNASQVSAWAGIHYFACRYYDRRISEQYPSDTLTWEKGNAFLTDSLVDGLESSEIRNNAAVVSIQSSGSDIELCWIDVETGQGHKIRARSVVYAGKLHAAPYVVRGLPKVQKMAMQDLTYSPWLVAALHLREAAANIGPLAWENVMYDSPSVGYVYAGHQAQSAVDAKATLVYYRPFTEDVSLSREALLRRGHGYWADTIMADLVSVHPNMPDLVEKLDVYLWGHGMVRPVPELIWGSGRHWREQPHGSVAFATCDVSGLPLFEEAAFWGIRAAEYCLNVLGVNFQTSLSGLVGRDI